MQISVRQETENLTAFETVKIDSFFEWQTILKKQNLTVKRNNSKKATK